MQPTVSDTIYHSLTKYSETPEIYAGPIVCICGYPRPSSFPPEIFGPISLLVLGFFDATDTPNGPFSESAYISLNVTKDEYDQNGIKIGRYMVYVDGVRSYKGAEAFEGIYGANPLRERFRVKP